MTNGRTISKYRRRHPFNVCSLGAAPQMDQHLLLFLHKTHQNAYSICMLIYSNRYKFSLELIS